MIGQMLDVMFLVVRQVVWLKRHAVVAHAVGAVFAKRGVASTRYFPIFGAPELINGFLFY